MNWDLGSQEINAYAFLRDASYKHEGVIRNTSGRGQTTMNGVNGVLTWDWKLQGSAHQVLQTSMESSRFILLWPVSPMLEFRVLVLV